MYLFESFKSKSMTLRNRTVLPPMDMYSAGSDGFPNDIHFTHYVSRAIGGVGLLIFEATAIARNGRISNNCLGIWDDNQIEGLKRIVQACQAHGAKTALQINHAGRKCTADDVDFIVAPSPIAFSESYRTPKELTTSEISSIVDEFKEAARRANEAGFDALEIHGAHGYLISEFLSPITNKRTDEYGGSLENRTRFLKEILEAVNAVWPSEKPILLRVSAYDYLEEGMQVKDMVEIINMVKSNLDIVDVSSGGVALAPISPYPGYQIGFSEEIKNKCQLPTITVGLITESNMVEEILGNKRADLVALGRELFRNPQWVLNTAWEKGLDYEYPKFYQEAFKKKR